MRKCTKCGESKPATSRWFYRDKNSRSGLFSWCKTCLNAIPKTQTRARVIRNRARHRAIARLVELHRDQFEALYESARADAIEEDEWLSGDPENVARFAGQTPRLKPGPRQQGEVQPRIDDKWCATCSAYHARGHHEKKEPVLPALIEQFNQGTARARAGARR